MQDLRHASQDMRKCYGHMRMKEWCGEFVVCSCARRSCDQNRERLIKGSTLIEAEDASMDGTKDYCSLVSRL